MLYSEASEPDNSLRMALRDWIGPELAVSGYASPLYAASLHEFGEPIRLARSC